LPLVGSHRAEIADCGTQFLPAIGRQISELRKQLPRLLLLIGSQVLPGFHALQDAVLLLLREAAETQQPFPQDLLPGRRKVAELGIVVESFLLLIGRQVLVTAEPLSGVTGLRLLPRFLPLLASFSGTTLSPTRRSGGGQQRGRRRYSYRDGLQRGHCF
jgi:hypothetical protein